MSSLTSTKREINQYEWMTAVKLDFQLGEARDYLDMDLQGPCKLYAT